MSFDPVSAAIDLGTKLIDKFIPDPAQKDKAKLELLKQSQEGGLKETEQQLSAIIAEAKSSDPWTSRARPSFLYVMYLMILFAIPMGVLSVFKPEASIQVAEGMKSWLRAIPNELYYVFGLGYSGYTAFRSMYDKTGK
jgi:hypothetical protein